MNHQDGALLAEYQKHYFEYKKILQKIKKLEQEDLSDERVESMLKMNAPALLLGYMRPIVAGLTNSSNFATYNLPFINFKE